jgi:hypothetical protein
MPTWPTARRTPTLSRTAGPTRGAPGTIEPTADVALIAAYYRGDQAATLRLADHSYSGNSPGESARTDRIDGPLTDACRALTHP